MKSKAVFFILFVYFCKVDVNALSFPGPRVYVVTPSSRSVRKDENKIAPFYYHNWMRRMDSEQNVTTTTTPAPTVKTPDLIFAEFESDGSQKSIRKLLEKEKIAKTSTMSPIYVPDDEENKVTRVVNYGLPVNLYKHDTPINDDSTEKSTHPFMFDNDYYNNVHEPVYLPSTTQSTTKATTKTTTKESPVNIENIWHIIDDEKLNQYSGNWQEVQVNSKEENAKNNNENDENTYDNQNQLEDEGHRQNNEDQSDEVKIDENFALPGFATNPGSGAENESRAIRTEPNIRFPYVNLKPFQMKPSKKPSYQNLSNSKKNSNLLTNLDNFSDLKHPVRGEAQDINPINSLIDRYNPAQPYLPQPSYGSKISKQSSPVYAPPKATANLVPPPLPPSKASDDDFPAPVSYDSFPPYAPSGPSYNQVVSPPPSPTPSVSVDSPFLNTPDSSMTSDASDSDDIPMMDLGYRYKPPSNKENSDDNSMANMGYEYKPPSPPVPQFFPTVPPAPKPFAGYTYNKPSMIADLAPMVVADKPEVQGYHYTKPESSKPPTDYMPQSYDSHPPYSHDDLPPHGHNSDYPDLIFQKPHDDMKGGDMKDHDIGMMPPSPQSDMKPDTYGPSMNDHGFPVDFPTDFKFHHDFDDHDHDHYHYHHDTTTSTTETPRVNRFSYYYLGKKLYYLPLYFSVYFIIYVGALIIKAVLRHKIVYPNSWRPNTTTATFFSKRSVDEFTSNENLHELTSKVTHAIATAAEKYMSGKNKKV
nr:adhesive plaque matrix protein [Vanessa tameamea]